MTTSHSKATVLTQSSQHFNRTLPINLHVLNYTHPQSLFLHTHDFCEIGITLSGSVIHTSQLGCHTLNRGDVYFLSPGAYHSLEVTSSWTVCNLLFLPELFETQFITSLQLNNLFSLFIHHVLFDKGQDIYQFSITKDFLPSLDYLIEALVQPPCINTEHLFIYQKNLFLNLLLILSNGCPLETSSLGCSTTYDGYFIKVINVLHTYIHLDSHSLISYLCNYFEVSSAVLNNLFKNKLHLSVSQYIIKFKIIKSCNLLLLNNESITDIALSLGFYDASHFSRCFKQFMDCSPKDYQQKTLHHFI